MYPLLTPQIIGTLLIFGRIEINKSLLSGIKELLA
jgi:hypothetical protein